MKRALAAWIWMACGTAGAASVHGKLVEEKLDPQKTVIYVDAVPAGSFVAKPAKASISQKGARFTPELLPILVGSDVDMSNDDWIEHSAYSNSLTKVFDLGMYKGTEKRVVTFDKPGVVDVGCYIHENMSATILVLKNPFFTRPNADGTFVIDGLPAGSFTLKVFRRGKPESSMAVQVPKAGSVQVELKGDKPKP
jgi:plastocyanin